MTAVVVSYSAHPEDDRLTLKVCCATCEHEWGWMPDTAANSARAKQLAVQHDLIHRACEAEAEAARGE